ncbi:uncharacterized protein [Branchiostoma lanceolatum]|uniref:uncharacterized protein n=1 Tax=Branchiostoma lanceolatum TaxID=7740 RepID=UPI0034541822
MDPSKYESVLKVLCVTMDPSKYGSVLKVLCATMDPSKYGSVLKVLCATMDPSKYGSVLKVLCATMDPSKYGSVLKVLCATMDPSKYGSVLKVLCATMDPSKYGSVLKVLCATMDLSKYGSVLKVLCVTMDLSKYGSVLKVQCVTMDPSKYGSVLKVLCATMDPSKHGSVLKVLCATMDPSKYGSVLKVQCVTMDLSKYGSVLKVLCATMDPSKYGSVLKVQCVTMDPSKYGSVLKVQCVTMDPIRERSEGSVCNYGPEGNAAGARPYVSGAACSRCSFGNVCTEDGLCIMDAPEDLSVTDVTFSSVSVSWTGSTSFVINYVLTYARQGGREREVLPAPGPRDTSATIEDLFAGTDYVITLKATGTLMESLPVTVTQATESVIVNVECDATSMGVQIPLAGLPGINSSRVRLTDPQCRGAVDSDTLVIRTDLMECGTTSQTTNGSDVIAFTNELVIDASPGQAVMSWPISCNFLVADWVGFEGEGLLFEIPKPSIQVEDGEHKFNFNMHVFQSEAFASPFRTSDYPISVFPFEPLYFGLFVDTSLPGYVMFAETCFATPSPDPQATPRYNIIENGCHVDESLTVYDTSQLQFRFSISSAQFQAESMVYVHCRMIVCMEDDSRSRCAQGCVDPNAPIRSRRRRSRDGGEDKRQALMKQGPILIVHEKDDPVVLWSVIACVLGIAYPALCAAAVCCWCVRRRRRAKTAAGKPEGFGGSINMGFVRH